ncbi:MAG: caspase family protein [Bacteroidota bacterium]
MAWKMIMTAMLIAGCVCQSNSQELKSKKVGLRIAASPARVPEIPADTAPPQIKIISPVLADNRHFETSQVEIDIVGEVTDDSKIRFISVNNDIDMVNETGIFTSRVFLTAGENIIRLKSMDDHSNLQEKEIVITYKPVIVTLADKIRKESNYYGLLIGVSQYRDPNLPDLDNPVHDARQLYRTLTSKYEFKPENTTLLENPGRIDLVEKLDSLREIITAEDNLLIFYAGHGKWDETAQIGYWLPSDAGLKSTANWFRNSTLVDYLKAIKSKHTLLITDACFAGSIFKARSVPDSHDRAYERLYELPSRKAMTSGAYSEVPDESQFIKYLIRRLEENEEEYLTSEALYGSFKIAVMSNTNTTPLYGEIQNVENEGGDFIFLKK